jgi:DNA-binding SARP family transcriptional activator/TolB-like protein/tetratricopeptide (TPR) repeat protein
MYLRLLDRLTVYPSELESIPVQLSTRKAGALLAYLGMRPDHTASREQLATLLWGGCSDQQARQSLRQALALLRKELGSPSFFTADAKIVRLEPKFWTIDAREFETLSRSLDPQDLARATRLFSGDFLADLNIDDEAFADWVSAQRSRLQLAAAQLCETFVKYPDLVADPGQAIEAVEKLLALDPLREDWHRLALTLYMRYRGRNETLARANGFIALLRRELDVAPEKATRLLIDSIRSSETAVAEGVEIRNESVVVSAADVTAAVSPVGAGSAVTAATAGKLRPKAVKPWMGRMTIAVLAVAGLAVAGEALWHGGPQKVQTSSVASTPQAASPLWPDPWRSPFSTEQARLPNGIIPIVVLPFTGLGDATDKSLQLAADLLTDDLTNILSRAASFRVISGLTARSYRGQATDVARIGAELQVRYVVSGSVRLQGNDLRVNVELINPATRLSVWSDRVDRSEANRQGVRDEIVSRLSHELQIGVPPIESLRLSTDFDADALAYRGWATLTEVSLPGYQQALALFNQALERDPQNLSAQIGIGAYHARMGVQVLDGEPTSHRAKAQEILRQALQREPNSSRAHFYLALALNQLPTLPEAQQHLESAIRIDPSNASAYAQIGNGLIRAGRPAEGLENVQYAMRLSPRDPVMPVWLEFAGNAELELGDNAGAVAMFQRAIALNPSYPRSWAGLVAAHALGGQFVDARRGMEKLKAFEPNMNIDALLRQFGRAPGSKLYEGLRLALAQQGEH